MSGSDREPVRVEAIRVALDAVHDRIRAAGGDERVAVLAVTKGFPAEVIAAAIAAGCVAIGENYAQELVHKRAVIEAFTPRPEVHFIGQLQTNKVRQLVDLVDVYESVDRPSLVNELAKRAPGARVLIQVDATGEPGKGGCPLADLDHLVEQAVGSGLALRGLMTVGPTEGGPEAARPAFRAVRAAVDRLGLAVCSMGMTTDLEVAVEEGSTEIRVGTALFGMRPVPAPHEQER